MRLLYGLALTLVLALALGGFPPAAGAFDGNGCIDRCYITFSPSQMGGSTELRRECLEQCKPSNGGGSSGPLHGAIAFGPHSGGWGAAYHMGSASRATASAMAQCRKNGPDCEIVASYTDTCAAVAAVKPKGRYFTGQNRNVNQAKAAAMSACHAQFGGACVAWVHSCASDTH